MDDFDSPWKDMLDWYFKAFMAFFFPEIHAAIDWSRGYEFLDKELQKIMKDAKLGRRVVDKLVKVWLTNGKEEWILIHIEIQTMPEPDFARRVFVYGYRLFDRYNRKVVSLAVLADDRADWKPDRFSYSMWGYELGVRFPVVKLLEYADRIEELERSDNPFAIVVVAHLKALATRRKPQDRHASKMTLVKGLYERGWKADDIRKLFHFIDWVMALPEDLDKSFWQEFHDYEEEKHMPYITSVERIGIEKGRKEGFLDALGVVVKSKFPRDAAQIMKLARDVDDIDTLRAALRAIKTAKTPDDVLAALNS